MSLHKSLVYRLSRIAKRNVLSRKERIDILMATGTRSNEDSVFGLPKVKPEGLRILSKRTARARTSGPEK